LVSVVQKSLLFGRRIDVTVGETGYNNCGIEMTKTKKLAEGQSGRTPTEEAN